MSDLSDLGLVTWWLCLYNAHWPKVTWLFWMGVLAEKGDGPPFCSLREPPSQSFNRLLLLIQELVSQKASAMPGGPSQLRRPLLPEVSDPAQVFISLGILRSESKSGHPNTTHSSTRSVTLHLP